MPNIRVPLGSKEYVKLPLVEYPDGVTSLDVEMSIVAYPGHAAADDWHTAEWDPGATAPTCRVLIGPDTSLDLDEGTYILRARITADPERPIVAADGLLEIV
ncbi:MAG TPA: hypothetical protein VIR33_01595 [Thermopolyspora sp.]